MSILIDAAFQVVLFLAIPLMWWVVTARGKENFFSWIGLKRPVMKGSKIKNIIGVIVFTVVMVALTAVVMIKLMNGTDTATSQFSGQGWSALPSILVYAVIQTSLTEEILFRGFLGKRLINKFGFSIGNTIQAVLFGLLHGIPFGILTGNIFVAVLLTLLPGSIGWAEGLINEKYADGSITPSWVMHAVINVLSALGSAL